MIYNNVSLSSCEVESVCDYLSNPNGIIEIHDNAPGCNSQEEVEEACQADIQENYSQADISIYPNPAQNELYISGKDGVRINEVNIYNTIGEIVLHKEGIIQYLDVSQLQRGMYIIEVINDKSKIRTKLIIN